MKHLLATLLIGLFALSPVHAAKFKKWVDEHGVTHYGTSIPPQYINRSHTELNEQGIAVDQQGRARTADEVAQEREIKRLKAAQAKLLEQQQQADQVLLNLYRSEDDLIMVRDGKVAQLDAQIAVKEKDIQRLKQRMSALQKRAADLERVGRPLDQNTSDDMRGTQRQIEETYAGILARQKQKEAIAGRYNAELERFRQLKQIDSSRTMEAASPTSGTTQQILVETAVSCSGSACDALWNKAVAYARRHATTSVEVMGPRILMTSAPREQNDIAITLSRIAEDDAGRERIFLDVQCAGSISAKAFCEGPDVSAIRTNFRPSVEN